MSDSGRDGFDVTDGASDKRARCAKTGGCAIKPDRASDSCLCGPTLRVTCNRGPTQVKCGVSRFPKPLTILHSHSTPRLHVLQDHTCCSNTQSA